MKKLFPVFIIVIICCGFIMQLHVLKVNATMKTSENGIQMIKEFEGLKLHAYKADSSEKYYTIGYGHYGADVSAGMVITEAQAESYLRQDLTKAEGYVNTFTEKYNISLSQNQFDALVSFSHNLGNVWVTTDFSLRTYLINGIQNYSSEQITTSFTNWHNVGGKFSQGLFNRRQKEAAYFLSGTIPCGNWTIDTHYPVPFKAYPANVSGKTSVYNSSGNAYDQNTRYIAANDLCTISAVYDNGFCEVTYPTSNGTHTEYARTSDFITNAVTPYSYSPPQNETSYTREDFSSSFGEVFSSDPCTVVGESSDKLQLIYPITGGNKLGWIHRTVIETKPNLGNSVNLGDNFKAKIKNHVSGKYITTHLDGNVILYNASAESQQVYEFRRQSDNSYIITSVYNGKCINSWGATSTNGENITTHDFAEGDRASAWYIHQNGNQYIFKSSCTDYHVIDVTGMSAEDGTNIQLHEYNASGAQLFEIEKISDTESPVVSDIKIINKSSEGYTVSCTVTDNTKVDRVQFPCWTEYNGQDDIQPDWGRNSAASGTKNGDTYTYDVKISEHNHEYGLYHVHIYAYDIYGNNRCFGAPDVEMIEDKTKPVISDVKITNQSVNGFTVTCTATDNIGIDRVQFPTWTAANGQDDIQSEWWKNPAASGNKDGDTYTYDVRISAHNNEYGLYYVHIYAYDTFGNEFCYPVPDITVSNEFLLTIDPVGGTLSNRDFTGKTTDVVTYDTKLLYNGGNWWRVRSCIPTKEGYVFDGFYTEKDGGTKVYNADGTCTNEGKYFKNNIYVYPDNLKVYAHWKEILNITLKNGEQYKITGYPENFTYTSSNSDVAVVSKTGIITAIDEGSAIISIINTDFAVEQLKITVISANNPISGDINNDGKTSILDIILLQKNLHGQKVFTETQYKSADINLDGKLNIYDLILLKRSLLKK